MSGWRRIGKRPRPDGERRFFPRMTGFRPLFLRVIPADRKDFHRPPEIAVLAPAPPENGWPENFRVSEENVTFTQQPKDFIELWANSPKKAAIAAVFALLARVLTSEIRC